MWKYNINQQYSEDVQPDPARKNALNEKPLPVGKRLIVDVDFTNDLGDTRNQKIVVLSEKGFALTDTVEKFIKQQMDLYEGQDESTMILENAKVIDDYLATL